jgi:hypothetical protein
MENGLPYSSAPPVETYRVNDKKIIRGTYSGTKDKGWPLTQYRIKKVKDWEGGCYAYTFDQHITELLY